MESRPHRPRRSDPVPAGHARTGEGDERLWDLPDPSPFEDEESAVSAVRTAIEASLDAVSTDGLAVAFSGGVDSAVVGSAFDCPLYVAGYSGSHDVAAARTAADLMDRDLRVVEMKEQVAARRRASRHRPRHAVDGRVPNRARRQPLLRGLRPRTLALPAGGRRGGHRRLR
nr:hypothetical protein [Haladaptatus sp. W1]